MKATIRVEIGEWPFEMDISRTIVSGRCYWDLSNAAQDRQAHGRREVVEVILADVQRERLVKIGDGRRPDITKVRDGLSVHGEDSLGHGTRQTKMK